jgi:ATPase subunit of ABC transporter with duplicated ATPase domains
MSVLSAQNLGKSFGPVDIFEDLTFAVPRRARIAIVAPTASAKPPLRILAGVENPPAARCTRARLTLGYLPLEAVTIREEAVVVCQKAFEELMARRTNLKP